MKNKNMKRSSRTDWERLRNMKDSEIDYSDIPPLDDNFFKNAVLIFPNPKPIITIRLDSDVLDWFKSLGKGYQTKINAVLRAYVKAQKAFPKHFNLEN